MKILSITAGAANMYCGSCLRDNSLARELIRQGHDVILLPLYTPTKTDEPNVSQPRVFFGGISIYLEQKMSLFRRTPKLLDRVWDAPPVIAAFAGRGITVDPGDLGALTVSMLEGAEGRQAKEIEKLTEWLATEPRPEVVTLPYTLLIALARPLKRVTGRPVICTLQGEELFLEGLPEPHRSRALTLIRSEVEHVDRFIAVSDYEARFMSSYLGIPEAKIRTVPLGINLDGFEPAERNDGVFRVGYLARVAPEKGLHLLAKAFQLFRAKSDAQVKLEAAGYLAPEHKNYLAGIQAKCPELHYHGEVDRAGKIAFLQSLDVLSVPCTYDEPKGLFVLEALGCGVPVVQPRRGSFPELLGQTQGGLLTEPDSAEALADALLRLVEDASMRRELGRLGMENVRREWTVEIMARRAADVYALKDSSIPSDGAIEGQLPAGAA
ncbi:MAG: glycosyltransferase family 4 protein [Acidimicrobiia bacterium]|nr:glycosyltransferase family 4 protein [Acidimicrobiia bacterium]